ncbi:MAG: peroxiredoxin [Epsilonproteobacteria bacterium]|nr:peroxiredoxin [Campylobacterota bacterium]
MAKVLKVGAQAPAFSLKDENGNFQSLEDMLKKSDKVLIYFYPMDGTPGCTKQACNLRDNIADLKKAGIGVWGISYDSVKSHKKFKEKHNLSFSLLSDIDKKVAKKYGAKRGLLPVPKRISYLISKDGIIEAVFKDVDVSQHAQNILDAIK